MISGDVPYGIPYSDDIELAGLLRVPDDPNGPLVILLHGFTGWKEEEHLATLAAALAVRGIGSFRYDAPGSGNSGGTFARDYRQTNYLLSVGQVVDHLRSDLDLQGARLGVWGHSMGGFVAMESAVRLANFHAVCGSQPSTGRPSFTQDEVRSWELDGWASFPNRRFPKLELPYDFYMDRMKYDVRLTVGDLKAPLLLIGGTRDELAPVSQVREIFDAASEPKSYREFDTNHFYKLHSGVLAEINAVTVDFFEQHLR